MAPAGRLILLAALGAVGGVARATSLRGRVVVEPGGEPASRVALLFDADAAPAPAPATRRLDQVWVSFVPKVQAVAPGSTLTLTNSDEESHTVHAWLGGETLFNHATAVGAPPQEVRLDRLGVVTITCDIHRWMKAYVLVSRAPFSTVSDADGRFQVEVPDGTYRARAWRYDDLDDAAGAPGVEPGRAVGVFSSGREASIVLPPRRRAAPVVTVPRAVEPAENRGSASQAFARFGAFGGWPRGELWVLVLSALGMALGVAAAFGNFRLAERLGWSVASAFALGLVFAMLCAGLMLLGLHLAIGSALGLGLTIGTSVFAAEERRNPRR